MSKHPPYTESELVELVRAIDVRAPERLHSHVQALVDERSAQRVHFRWAGATLGSPSALRLRLGGAIAVAAAAALALVLALSPTGSPSALTLRQTSPLTLRAATMAAPTQSATHPAELAASVEGVSFPYWEDHFGWRASGARVDRVDGRAVTTVFYTDASHQRIGYAIVSGTPAPPASGGIVQSRDGTPYRYIKENGAWLVTWLRNDRRCIVSGRGIKWTTLMKLASWNDATAS
ncbi:MAG TPA: hypothetical protein VN892_06800 [Solirubrobacteraceae bacterium]|nr:hypothetical protein [Solirubrobacteraceae bacterium]